MDNQAAAHVKGRLRTHLIKGAAGSFVLQVGFAGFAFLNAIILARVLGPKGYGTFANAMAWVSLLTIPATFGFGVLLVRDVAAYRAQQKWALLQGLLHFSDRFVLVLSVILALVAAMAAGFIFSSPTQAVMRHTIWIALGLLPLFALYNLRQSALRGLEYIIRAQLPGMLVRPGLLLAGISLIYFFWPQHLSAPVAMSVNVCAGAVTLAMGIFWRKRLLPSGIKAVKAKYASRSWLKVAFPMMVYGGMQIVLGQTDIVMLGAMRGAEEVGLYAAANRLAFLLGYAMLASEMIMAPIMTRLYVNDQRERLQKIITKATRVIFIPVFISALFLIFFGKEILEIFGEKFVMAQTSLVILAVGRLLHVALGSGALLLSMTGNEKTVAYVLTGAVILNLFSNVILIPKYGIVGAAIASTISLVLVRIALAIYAAKRTGVHVTIFGAIRNA